MSKLQNISEEKGNYLCYLGVKKKFFKQKEKFLFRQKENKLQRIRLIYKSSLKLKLCLSKIL